MDPEQLAGITTPVVTPFDDGEIDWTGYDSVLEHVLAGPVDAVFACGTTGEFTSLTTRERRRLLERTVERVPATTPVIAGGTTADVPTSVEWIENAADIGADAVVATAPYFHNSNGPDGLYHFFREIADEATIPILLYNIPSCVGEPIPADVVGDLADHDAIIGLKDSSGDLGYGFRVQARAPELPLLQGYDALLLPSLRMGFAGGVNALSNVVPGAYRELVDDPSAPSADRIHRDTILPLFEHCRRDGFAPAAKAGLVARGVIDDPAVRPPLVATDPGHMNLDGKTD